MATAPRIPDLAACSADELRTLVIRLLEANAKLEAMVAAQAEEIARLKNLKGRPQIKPSGMEKGTDPEAGVAPGDGTTKKKRRRPRRKQGQPKSARLIVDDDHVVPFTPEPGWRFKGYKPYTVQNLIIEVRVTRSWRPFYLTPEGKLVVAPLPAARQQSWPSAHRRRQERRERAHRPQDRRRSAAAFPKGRRATAAATGRRSPRRAVGDRHPAAAPQRSRELTRGCSRKLTH